MVINFIYINIDFSLGQNCSVIQIYFSADKVSNKVDLQLADLLPTSKSFYRYFGSLTTPPCYESVKWTVLQSTFKIPKKTVRYNEM